MPPSPFKLRPFELSDAEAAVQLLNAGRTTTSRRAVIDQVGRIRLSRYVPADAQSVVVTNAQNEIVAYAYLANREQAIIFEVGGTVHPHYRGQGLGRMIVDWAQKNAQSLAVHAPSGVKTVLQTNLFEDEHEAIQLFAASDYTKVREWLHLEIELQLPPPLPTLPGGMIVREMDLKNDWDIVGPVMDEAFANHWGTITLPPSDSEAEEEEESADDEAEDESYSNAPGFCFILMDDDIVAGAVLCNARLVERSDTGRVGSLFVRPAYQRQGIGRTLMLAAFNAFWQHGIRRIITDTDADSFSQTPRFYAGLGMAPYRREFLYEKEIRPGKEVRKLNKAPLPL